MKYKEFREKVRSVVYDIDDFMFGEDQGSCNPTWNIGKRNEEEKKRAIYAVKFYEEKQFFAIWNLKRHRDFNASLSWLSISNSWNDIKFNIDAFAPYYKGLGTASRQKIEKIYVVGLHNFEKFFCSYGSYMQLNTLDDEFPQNFETVKKEADNVQWFDESEREKYSSSRHKRDIRFRTDVLMAYDYQCAVCRCKAVKLLEAAHERGYEVATTNHDDPKHGICLCANHHLMYDKLLIDLDLNTHELQITEEGMVEQIENMSWYKEFQEKYKGRILERNDHS
ncbi:MAG: hypothetical protein HDR09_10075 [Lachnospiraceae bacterium]|nr:hypothetical protein [Lachnospiraceae bacterium]